MINIGLCLSWSCPKKVNCVLEDHLKATGLCSGERRHGMLLWLLSAEGVMNVSGINQRLDM